MGGPPLRWPAVFGCKSELTNLHKTLRDWEIELKVINMEISSIIETKRFGPW